MATINKFQDLDVWKTSKEMAIHSYNTFREVEDYKARPLILQIIRSVVSIPSNIAEGFEREGNKEFVNFLSIAKGSNGEFYTQLLIAFKVHMIQEDEFRRLESLSLRIGFMLKKLIVYLNKTDYRGQKFNSGVREEFEQLLPIEHNAELINSICNGLE
jgi:four helix bundle protein